MGERGRGQGLAKNSGWHRVLRSRFQNPPRQGFTLEGKESAWTSLFCVSPAPDIVILTALITAKLNSSEWIYKALKTQRTISHPEKYIFLGMILCREQFLPSENKVLALPGREQETEGGAGRWSLQASGQNMSLKCPVVRGSRGKDSGLSSAFAALWFWASHDSEAWFLIYRLGTRVPTGTVGLHKHQFPPPQTTPSEPASIVAAQMTWMYQPLSLSLNSFVTVQTSKPRSGTIN